MQLLRYVYKKVSNYNQPQNNYYTYSYCQTYNTTSSVPISSHFEFIACRVHLISRTYCELLYCDATIDSYDGACTDPYKDEFTGGAGALGDTWDDTSLDRRGGGGDGAFCNVFVCGLNDA